MTAEPEPEYEHDDARIWTAADPHVYTEAELHETPVTARARCKRIGTLQAAAQIAVKHERAAVVEAEVAYRAARREAQLTGPMVQRGTTIGTVDDKTAWVERETADEYLAWKIAEARLEAARDYWRRVEAQGMLAQSILKSVDRAFVNVHTGEEGR